MRKQDFMAMSLPYNLKCKYITDRIQNYSATKYDAEFDNDFQIIRSIPVIRDTTTDLLKLIVQLDYSDGKPFVPIEILSGLKEFNILCNEGGFIQIRDKKSQQVYSFNSNNPDLKDTLLLIAWHFWPGMSREEQVIYVSNEFDPYTK